MPDTPLRKLLEANRLAIEHLDLPTALRQIVDAAVDLVGAEYGAIGVLGPTGALEEFIHVGMDDATVALIGPPPVGRGLIGALIAEPRPVRLATMSTDPRSVGFPFHHPEMNSFLGVPLEVREQIFGHLYLADSRVDAFSPDDQVLVMALAATAGVAIAHARLFQESKRREQWTAATTKITQQLLTDDDVDALQLIAETVLALAGADLVVVVLADGDAAAGQDLVVNRAAGTTAAALLDRPLHERRLVERCLRTRRPQLSESRVDLGPAMAVPLPAGESVRGGLFVVRDPGSPSFSEFDLDVAASLAGQASLALELADARVVRGRASTLEDRDRIARDLHDHVVQRLFATGLIIQSVCSAMGPGPASERLSRQIDEIDATIRQIRTTIFGLHVADGPQAGARARILEVVTAVTATLPGPPQVTFSGPLDLVVSPALCDDVVAVVREALTNVGRHACAAGVQLTVTAGAASIEVEVLDDGVGPGQARAVSGLANLRDRAELRGGSFAVESRPVSGTRLAWSAPLDPT